MENKISVKDFVNEFKINRVVNTKADPNGVSNFIRDKLQINEYIPFNKKREIAEMIVAQNLTEEDGIKHYDSIGSYMGFVIAMLVAHTALEMSANPIDDYDESEVLLKMTIAAKLEDNNLNVLIGKFLNGISEKINAFSDVAKDKLGNLNLKDIIGANIKEEDITKLISVLDTLK